MEQVKEQIDEWKEALANDPLYLEIASQNREDELFSIEKIKNLENKRWYSTVEIADFIGVTDGNLRYYIKLFVPYIFSEDSPTTGNAYRLDMIAAFKLKMMFMLKDEQKVVGLKRLLGMSEGYVMEDNSATVSKRKPADVPSTEVNENELLKRVAYLENMVGSLLKSDLFLIDKDENDLPVMRLKDSIIEERMKKYLGSDNQKELMEKIDTLSKEFEKVKEEKEDVQKLLRKQRDELYDRTNKDIAKRIAHQQIENEARRELQVEAVEAWNKEKRYGLFASLTKRGEIEQERERFIKSYIDSRLPELSAERIAAYEQPDSDLEDKSNGPA